jgi:hypothetical protein
MAKNIVRYFDEHFAMPVVVTHPAAPDSGDPVRYGVFTGVALTDEGAGGNAAAETTVNFGPCVVDVSVKGIDDSGNSAVAAGDIITYTDADTPPLSKKSSGYFFGFALEAVGSGLTGTIQVLKPATPGSGTLASGGVGATQLATGAVTAVKLSATLKTGFIPLDITSMREIATNDIQALSAHGGILASDSAPLLKRVNGATDKALRVVWTAEADTDEAQFAPVAKPADLDAGTNLTIHLLCAMEGTDDTPVIDVQVYDGVGDTEMGGATAAITGTTVAEYTVTIAHANVAAAPGFLNISLVPAAHETDDLYLYAAWIEYTRA